MFMTNLYVGNISYETTEDDLRSAFTSFGAIERVNIVTDRDTGRPRGFAFVEMAEQDAAEKAIAELNGSELQGRAITVNEARPKPTHGGGYGGGRRGSGGGRDRGTRW
jgi:RNA recognition motif-containing protein